MNGNNPVHRFGLRLMVVGLAVMVLTSLISLIRVWMMGEGPSPMFSFSVVSLLITLSLGIALLVLAFRSPRTGGLVNLVVYSGTLLMTVFSIFASGAEPVWWQLAGRMAGSALLITGSLLVYRSAGQRQKEIEV